MILVSINTSCAPIPFPIGLFTKRLYSSEKLQILSRKDADRKLVRQTFGDPKAIRSAGKYWFYSNIREYLGFIGTDLVFQDFEWLAVRFDVADHVNFVEYNDSVNGCLSNGICNYSGLLYSNPSLAVLSAPRDEDEFIKSYKVGKDECAIYFYLEPFSFRPASGSVTFFVDGKPFGVTNYKTYLFIKQPPGEIHIGAYQFRITIQCRAGEKIYIKAVESWKSYKRGKDLCPVIAAKGEKAIRSRKLALSY